MDTPIPFNIPEAGEREIEAIADAIRSGHLSGGGAISARVQHRMQDMFGVKHVLLTTSCTHAMELALMTAGIGSGDEVIVPSFTFSSTANAIVLQGATPVFAEIEQETLNIDPADIERRITSRTRAIMPVHYNGVGCRMDEIMALADMYGLLVIEDAAQGVGARYQGQYLGTIGHVGCYSFHGIKNITCGEGGAFLTNDEALFHHAEIVREKGTNRQAFLRGQVDKYTWVARGSSYVLSDILAVMLEAQLERVDEITAARKAIYWRYVNGLADLAEQGKIRLPAIPKDCESNYHLFFLRTRTIKERHELLYNLRQQRIEATFHYVPLHSSPFGRRFCTEELPLTERASRTLIRLPLFPRLTSEAQNRVISTVRNLKE